MVVWGSQCVPIGAQSCPAPEYQRKSFLLHSETTREKERSPRALSERKSPALWHSQGQLRRRHVCEAALHAWRVRFPVEACFLTGATFSLTYITTIS
jgi:hypothetical protein